jgi:sulfide:quinone oxidoreductase
MRDKVEITYVTPLSGAFTKAKSYRNTGIPAQRKKYHIEVILP